MGPLHSETAEEADSHEALEVDDTKYPQLPENVLELRLHRRKGILRQFMAAVRRVYISPVIQHSTIRFLRIITQDSTILMVVFRGMTSPRIRRTILQRGHNLIPTTNFKSHLT